MFPELFDLWDCCVTGVCKQEVTRWQHWYMAEQWAVRRTQTICSEDCGSARRSKAKRGLNHRAAFIPLIWVTCGLMQVFFTLSVEAFIMCCYIQSASVDLWRLTEWIFSDYIKAQFYGAGKDMSWSFLKYYNLVVFLQECYHELYNSFLACEKSYNWSKL